MGPVWARNPLGRGVACLFFLTASCTAIFGPETRLVDLTVPPGPTASDCLGSLPTLSNGGQLTRADRASAEQIFGQVVGAIGLQGGSTKAIGGPESINLRVLPCEVESHFESTASSVRVSAGLLEELLRVDRDKLAHSLASYRKRRGKEMPEKERRKLKGAIVALLIGHEIGHVVRGPCRQREPRDAIQCEAEIDKLGARLAREAGYRVNPAGLVAIAKVQSRRLRRWLAAAARSGTNEYALLAARECVLQREVEVRALELWELRLRQLPIRSHLKDIDGSEAVETRRLADSLRAEVRKVLKDGEAQCGRLLEQARAEPGYKRWLERLQALGPLVSRPDMTRDELKRLFDPEMRWAGERTRVSSVSIGPSVIFLDDAEPAFGLGASLLVALHRSVGQFIGLEVSGQRFVVDFASFGKVTTTLLDGEVVARAFDVRSKRIALISELAIGWSWEIRQGIADVHGLKLGATLEAALRLSDRFRVMAGIAGHMRPQFDGFSGGSIARYGFSIPITTEVHF